MSQTTIENRLICNKLSNLTTPPAFSPQCRRLRMRVAYSFFVLQATRASFSFCRPLCCESVLRKRRWISIFRSTTHFEKTTKMLDKIEMSLDDIIKSGKSRRGGKRGGRGGPRSSSSSGQRRGSFRGQRGGGVQRGRNRGGIARPYTRVNAFVVLFINLWTLFHKQTSYETRMLGSPFKMAPGALVLTTSNYFFREM